MDRGKSKARYLRGVFRRVLSQYDEIKSINGTWSCEQFYKVLANAGKGKGGGRNPRIIHASTTDFVCDVELAAKSTLSQNEWFFFKSVYLEKDDKFEAEVQTTLSRSSYLKLKHQIQEKVAAAFVHRKIYPVGRYFQPIDLR